jgi:hypothetical protein
MEKAGMEGLGLGGFGCLQTHLGSLTPCVGVGCLSGSAASRPQPKPKGESINESG